jgi:hypothetical protein
VETRSPARLRGDASRGALLGAIRSLDGGAILTMQLSILVPPFIAIGSFDSRSIVAMKNTVEIPQLCSVTLNLYLRLIFRRHS